MPFIFKGLGVDLNPKISFEARRGGYNKLVDSPMIMSVPIRVDLKLLVPNQSW